MLPFEFLALTDVLLQDHPHLSGNDRLSLTTMSLWQVFRLQMFVFLLQGLHYELNCEFFLFGVNVFVFNEIVMIHYFKGASTSKEIQQTRFHKAVTKRGISHYDQYLVRSIYLAYFFFLKCNYIIVIISLIAIQSLLLCCNLLLAITNYDFFLSHFRNFQ